MPEHIVSSSEESLGADPCELVRRAVEEMPDGLLDEEADDLVGAERYERTAGREACRAGHYERRSATTSGGVAMRMPKPKPEGMRFTTAIIERYRRREASVEEAMIETCLAGVSTRRIEGVSEILWGPSVSAATVSNPNEKAFEAVEAWRNRLLERAYPYTCVDGIYLKRSWEGSYENVAVMVAIGVNDDDHHREVIGAAEGFTESSECWREFLSWLKPRGLRWRPHARRRQGRRHGRFDCRGLPRRGLPALRRPLLPQRTLEGAHDPRPAPDLAMEPPDGVAASCCKNIPSECCTCSTAMTSTREWPIGSCLAPPSCFMWSSSCKVVLLALFAQGFPSVILGLPSVCCRDVPH